MRLTEKLFDHYYRVEGRIGDPCVYCGQPSNSYDHVPPLHYVARMSEAEVSNKNLRKLPACVECNSIIGGMVLTTVQERRKVVKKKLRQRYASFLRMPNWDEEELQELDPRLAEDIRRANRFARFVKARVSYY